MPTISLIMAAISFALTNGPVIVEEIQSLWNLLQKAFGNVPGDPTQGELDLLEAVTLRRAADERMKNQT
jgi:hypothetical protein